jgi:hypothetical protein
MELKLCLLEKALVCATLGTYPVFGHIFKFGSSVDPLIGIARGGIIDIATYRTAILAHGFPPCLVEMMMPF